MKKILLLTLVLLCAVLLCACGCKHETWNEADCENPKTCAECGGTEGEALGHTWQDAGCENPKTCSVCQKTEGEALGHTWQDAGCENPKTCSVCQKTEGEALGHTWQDATTEAPKTCSVCESTEGERIITDPRFTTAACAPLFGKWVCTIPVDGEMMDLEGFEGVLSLDLFMEFSNDGNMRIYTKVQKPEDFDAALKQYMVDSIYAEMALSGLNKEEADAAMKATAGMTVEEYVDAMLSIIDFTAMFEVLDMDGVYYVDGNQLYAGMDWDTMDSEEFSLVDGELVMTGMAEELGVDECSFTIVQEEAE